MAFRIHTDIQFQLRIIEEKIRGDPTPPTPTSPTPNPNINRQTKAFAIVSQVAAAQFNLQKVGNKFDLRKYTANGKTYYPWLFSKTLKHDDNGLSTVEDLDRLIRVSSEEGSLISINSLFMSQDPNKTRKLEGVATGNSFWIRGCDVKLYNASDSFPVDTLTHMCEMIEVYENALLRDIPFEVFNDETDTNVKRALKSLNNYNNLSSYTGPTNSQHKITGKELFRGNGKDELIGPYISQYLVLPYSYNGLAIDQKYPVENDVDETINYDNYLDIQRGIVGGPPNFSGYSKYAYSPRVLGSIVHNDPLYWSYYNGCLISKQNGIELDYNGNEVTSAWTDQGFPDLLESIAEISLGALRVAWNSKYNITLRLRPEAMAQRIDYIQKGIFTGDVFNKIKDNLAQGQETLDEVFLRNGNYLLLMMYPEGSPTHPSCPAGHAVVAGACTTVMKAFLKTHDSDNKPLFWPSTPRHSVDGDVLEIYDKSDKDKITIIGEINKLASNVSLGRDMGGVHYRADGDSGNVLGETFAIKYLQIKLKEYSGLYNGMLSSFKLEKFNGEFIEITNTDINVILKR
jgi:hypothetical protein